MENDWGETTDARRPRPSVRRTVIAGVVIWLLIISAGMGMLWRHTTTPGEAAQAPSGWPAGSALRPASGRCSLLMWCHPQCPCTRASLAELARLKALCGDRLAVTIIFEQPNGVSAQWVYGENWRLAVATPGSTVRVDRGVEASRFGARTSGQALLFDENGRLRFSGGLTQGRGHLGENAGFEAARCWVLSGQESLREAPVFGCALFSDPSGQPTSPARLSEVGSLSEGQTL